MVARNVNLNRTSSSLGVQEVVSVGQGGPSRMGRSKMGT
jgi:hypothetical protein